MVSMQKLKATDPERFMYYKESESHCTIILKLLRDSDKNIKDLYIGHSTWDDYNEMIRIYKSYNFTIKDKSVKVSFSS